MSGVEPVEPGHDEVGCEPRDTVEDRVNGLRIGGDDYMTKPFSLDEIIALGASGPNPLHKLLVEQRKGTEMSTALNAIYTQMTDVASKVKASTSLSAVPVGPMRGAVCSSTSSGTAPVLNSS